MIVRRMDIPDWAKLPEFRKQYEFDWKFPENTSRIAASCAVEDDSGKTIAVCAAELVPSVTLAIRQTLHPLVLFKAGLYAPRTSKDVGSRKYTLDVPVDLLPILNSTSISGSRNLVVPVSASKPVTKSLCLAVSISTK